MGRDGKQSQVCARQGHLSLLPPQPGQAHRTGDGRSDWGHELTRQDWAEEEDQSEDGGSSCQPDSFHGQLVRAGMQRAQPRGGLACHFGILGRFI